MADVPGSVDAFASSNAALLHLDGPNGSAAFTDVMGHTFTGVGSPTLSTAQKKFGSASLSLNGTTQYIQSEYTSDWDMPGDFTAEAWIYANSLANSPTLIDRWSTYGWQIVLGPRPYAILQNSSNAVYPIAPLGTVPDLTTGEWHHIALTRSGDTARLFVDGLMHVAMAFTGALPAVGTSKMYIGCQNGSLSFFNGYIDEIRLTKGLARYVSDFIPSEVPFGTPDTTLAQRLAGVTQSANGTVSAGADRSFAGSQTLAAVTQAASAKTMARLSGTQSLAGVTQAATMTVPVVRTFVAAQALAGVAQGANAAVAASIAAGQTLDGVTQAATVSVPAATAAFSAVQVLDAVVQEAGSVATAKAAAAQSLDGVGQSAAVGSKASASGVQTLDAAVGAATAIAFASAQAVQTLAGVSQAATATVADTVHTFIAAQVLASVVQTARVRPAYIFERNERTVRVVAEDRRIGLTAEHRRVAILGERRAAAFTD